MSECNQLVGNKGASGCLPYNLVPAHGRDAAAGSFASKVFLAKHFAFGNIACCNDALAGNVDVGTFGIGSFLYAVAESGLCAR